MGQCTKFQDDLMSLHNSRVFGLLATGLLRKIVKKPGTLKYNITKISGPQQALNSITYSGLRALQAKYEAFSPIIRGMNL